MDLVEPVKRLAKKATGVGIPSRDEALACVIECELLRMTFKDDGYIPNNPKLALLYYKKAGHPRRFDPAAVLESLFNLHSWARLGATASTTSCITTR